MKASLALVFSLLFLLIGGPAAAVNDHVPDQIDLPSFWCPVQLTLYIVYEPNAGPGRNFDTVKTTLSEWARLGVVVGESARVTESKTDEDGMKRVTRATTIVTRGRGRIFLPKTLLNSVRSYAVEDPTTDQVFIYWSSGMETSVWNVRAPIRSECVSVK